MVIEPLVVTEDATHPVRFPGLPGAAGMRRTA